MKMMQGAFFLPCSKRSRTRLAPTPTNISTKSEPEIEKNGTLASPAIARASKRLARAWRPDEQHTLGNAAAEFLEFLRIFQELNDFLEFFLGFVGTRDVLKGGFLLLRGKQTRAGLAEAQGFIAAGLHLTHQEKAETDEQKQWRSVQQNQNPIAAANFLHLDLNTLVPQLLGDVGSGFLEDGHVKFLVRPA